METAQDRARGTRAAPIRGAAPWPGAGAQCPRPDGAERLQEIWPRRFDRATLRELLGEEIDRLCCDVLTAGVSAPVWTLADRGGGRWRPAISRLAFEAAGGAPPAPDAICQVAELLHTGSLIIDDIQDGAAARRGGPAVHALYGTPAAINAANAAYFRALEALRGALPDCLRLRALDMLSEELFRAHLGQALDLALGAHMRHGTVRVAHYLLLARAKTGALVRIAARLGAITAAAGPSAEAALGDWASELGVAYQIRNDLDDLDAGMCDVAACRPTYPLVLALEDGGPGAAMLRATLGRPVLGDGAVEALRAILVRERIPDRARAAADAALARALGSMRALPASAARDGLEGIALDLMGRPGGPGAR
jgi:geranylgeranyl pyrophosphate synthase